MYNVPKKERKEPNRNMGATKSWQILYDS